jgi:cell division protease FtsH
MMAVEPAQEPQGPRRPASQDAAGDSSGGAPESSDGPGRRRHPAHHKPPRTPEGWRVEGAPQQPPGATDGEPSKPPSGVQWLRRIWLIVVAALVVNWIVVAAMTRPNPYLTSSYTFFRQQVEAGNVAQITSKGDTIQGVFRHAVTARQAAADASGAASGSGASGAAASGAAASGAAASDSGAAGSGSGGKAFTRFQTQLPAFGTNDLLALLTAKGVVVSAKPPASGTPLWETLLLYFGPALLFIAIFVYFGRRAAAAGGGMLSAFGRSRARRYEPSQQQRTTFADVAGIDEAKAELSEVVDFLREPDRYRRLGARIPRGVLLSGVPGTGKTLLARAVAGEAQVPFFWLSASEFVEVLVGVGASRVRDLFSQAKAAAPAIIFIDELDAIGRARSSGVSLGGNDEREQTLNQILTEMDGFTGTEGVIVMAATNRAEVLDPALLRPGRFDRRVTVSPPDAQGRAAILRVHARDVPLAPDVDLEGVASQTPGMVGADLANLVNEAALLAARRGHERVRQRDFSDALERVVLGSERRIVLSEQDRERTAYHESGHALLGMLQEGADPVRKVTIVPRGQALGVTFQSPSSDRYGYSASYLRGRIVGALGGRAAEELVYGDVTTGAESDLEQITSIARQMVGRWGMSAAVGPVTILPRDEAQPWAGPDGGAQSDETRKLVDTESRRIVEECYQRARELLGENRERLDRLAHALLKTETLDEDEAYAAAGIDHRPAAARREAA